MATIQKRITSDDTVTYRVQVRLKGYPAQTASFDRLGDAKRWATQTEAAIREGRHFHLGEAKSKTVADLFERYLRDVLPKKKDSAQQARQCRWWVRAIGDTALSRVFPALIVEYRDKLAAEGKAAATRNRYLAVLSHAFSIAVREWQWAADNPVRKVRRDKEPRGRVRFLDDGERERLLDACRASPEPMLYPVVLLALATGMRSAEVMGLRWQNVFLADGFLVLHETKNGERRRVPLVGKARDVLREWSRVRRIDCPFVFPNTFGDGPACVRRAWVAARQVASIDDFRFHDLRHTTASYLAMNGATLAEIAEILGHKTLAMVKRYSHLSDTHVSAVLERMNRAILG